MAWVTLIIAGLFEVVWAVGLKYTQGFTRVVPSIITVAGMIVSVYLLAQASKTLPIGTAYAVWTGVGAVGAIILGIILFDESRDLARLFFLGLIVAGIIGLRFVAGGE
jgi:quaternary ammonium compound-resistance protein SugE